MSRPPQPDYVPDAEWEAVPDHSWRLITGKRCRFMINRRSCKQPSVAEFKRGFTRDGRAWWAYCPDHMFGRWIENGQVMRWVRAS